MAKSEKKNILSLSLYKFFNEISTELIKGYGAVFIYLTSGALWHVFLYLALYSIVQMSTNIIFKNLFSNNPKLALILRIIPFFLMFGIFFIHVDPLLFTIVISVTNGLLNSFYFAPIDNLNGSIKAASNPKFQSVLHFSEYFGIALITVLSGIILDAVDVKIVAAVGIVLYLVGTLIFYFKYNSSYKPQKNNRSLLKTTQQPVKIAIKQSSKQARKFNPFKNYYPWLTEGLIGTISTIKVLWAVYTFEAFQSFTMVGVLAALIYIFSIFGSLMVRLIKKRKYVYSCFLVALVFSSLIWATIPFAISSEAHIFILCILLGFFEPLILIPTYSAYFKNLAKKQARNKQFVKKDFYRKLFTLPLTATLFIINSLPIGITVSGALFGLTVIQAKPIFNIEGKSQTFKLSPKQPASEILET